MDAQVKHDRDRQRFVLSLPEGECLLTYRMDGELVVFDHTEVPEALQHQGLANEMAVAALDWARHEGLKVRPECRFMDVYMQRHPEYNDLLRQEPESMGPPHPMAGGTR